MTNNQIFENLKEELAEVEHIRWSHWQNYMHSKCIKNPDGSLTIPKNLVNRWENQSKTAYAKLTEEEKESDRKQVERYLPLLEKFFHIKNL